MHTAWGIKVKTDLGWLWLQTSDGFLINYLARGVAVAHANCLNEKENFYKYDVFEFNEEEVYRERTVEELEARADKIFGN